MLLVEVNVICCDSSNDLGIKSKTFEVAGR